MEISCSYNNYPLNGDHNNSYTCKIEDKDIPEGFDLKFIGEHIEGETDDNVICVWFKDCTVEKIPQNLTKSFPNLKILIIRKSKLKSISKDDLIEYKNLVELRLNSNEIEFLPGDLFEDFANLKKISFNDNKIRIIEPNILEGLDKLIYGNFLDNPNYRSKFSSDSNDKPNVTIEEFKKELQEKYGLQLYNEVQALRNQTKKLSEALSKAEHKIKKLQKQKFEKVFQQKCEEFDDDSELDFGESKLNHANNSILNEILKIKVNEVEYRVHKHLFSAKSTTIDKFLQENPGADVYVLEGVTDEIFELIFDFIYKQKFPISPDGDVMQLFIVFHDLGITELKEFIATKIIGTINHENAMEFIRIGNKYDHGGLTQRAFEKIKERYPFFRFKDELSIQPENLENILTHLKSIELAH